MRTTGFVFDKNHLSVRRVLTVAAYIWILVAFHTSVIPVAKQSYPALSAQIRCPAGNCEKTTASTAEAGRLRGTQLRLTSEDLALRATRRKELPGLTIISEVDFLGLLRKSG